jgi:hypothetical protein
MYDDVTLCMEEGLPAQFAPSISALVGKGANRYLWRLAVCSMFNCRLIDGLLQVRYSTQLAN